MSNLVLDLRFAVRQLAAKPGFAVAAILTLALGIGANTAVFSLLNGYLFKPLPYPHSNRLVQVAVNEPKAGTKPIPFLSLPLYQAIQKNADVFSAIALYHPGNFVLGIDGHARHVFGVEATSSLFQVLGAKPFLGRTFAPQDMRPGDDNDVVVISYRLWRDGFGADPDVLGRTVKLHETAYRIIGVMPLGFAFPDRISALWMPYPFTFTQGPFDLSMGSIGKLKPHLSLHAAALHVQRVVDTYLRDKSPLKYHEILQRKGFKMGVQSWRRSLLGGRPTILWLLQGAVLLILLIACVNVANLLLSRILGRSYEIAMRSALGATRQALVRQLLTEALLLAVPGGAAGIGLASLALHYLTTLSLGPGTTIFHVTLDWRVELFALGAALFTAMLVSVLPIRYLARTNLKQFLVENSGASDGARRTRRTRNVLVIAELTLATGLLATAGLLLHSFLNLEAVDPGFRTDHVLIASLDVTGKGRKALSSFYSELIQRVDALPGVRHAGLAQMLPLMPWWLKEPWDPIHFSISGKNSPATKTQQPAAKLNFVDPGYFKTLGIPMLRGRGFSANDQRKRVVIVNQGLVKRYFNGTDPIGQQLDFGGKGDVPVTVIGVVPSTRYSSLSTSAPSPTLYLPYARRISILRGFVVHTTIPPGALIKPLRHLVARLDPKAAIYNVHTMHQQLAGSLRNRRTTMSMILAFGAIAFALAIIGVYGVLSYAVGQRRNEFGVRLAMGATQPNLTSLVIKDGTKLLLAGLAIGLALAVGAGYALDPLLFHVAPYDPLTLATTAAVLGFTTLLACYLPARRAAKLNPADVIHDQ